MSRGFYNFSRNTDQVALILSNIYMMGDILTVWVAIAVGEPIELPQWSGSRRGDLRLPYRRSICQGNLEEKL